MHKRLDELPIIIGGYYRSGTSLLRRILDSHSHIHCSPEIKFFKDFYGDYKDDNLSHIRFFSTLPSIGLTPDELLLIFGAAFVESHRKAMIKSGKIRWADKNPENVLYLNQWKTLLPEGFIFLHVVRHPLDALASLKEVGFVKTVPESIRDRAELYLSYEFAAENYQNEFPDRCFHIRYEEIVKNPEGTLKEFLSKIGESFESEILNNFFTMNRCAGIEDPKVSKTQYIHSNSIERWKNDLTDHEVSSALEILKPLMDKYSYKY